MSESSVMNSELNDLFRRLAEETERIRQQEAVIWMNYVALLQDMQWLAPKQAPIPAHLQVEDGL